MLRANDAKAGLNRILVYVLNIKSGLEEYIHHIHQLEPYNIADIKQVLLAATNQHIESMNSVCQLCASLLREGVDLDPGSEDTKAHVEDIKLDLDDITSKMNISQNAFDRNQANFGLSSVKEEECDEDDDDDDDDDNDDDDEDEEEGKLFQGSCQPNSSAPLF